MELLRRVPLFADLERRELQEIAQSLKERTFDAGETVASEGEHGVGFFVIEDGEASVSVAGESRGRLGAPRELLDPPLRRVELGRAEAIQLLAALPERDRLLEPGLATLEALDDPLELGAGGFERLLAHGRTSSTRAPRLPSASATSSSFPTPTSPAARTTRPPVRTIA